MFHPSSAFRDQLARSRALDRRASARYHTSHDILCELNLFVGEAAKRAMLLDVSTGGLGLLMEEAIDPDISMIVTFSNSAGQFICRELVLVRHVTQPTSGCYHVGCEFVKELTRGDLRALTRCAGSMQPPHLARSGMHLMARKLSA